MEQATVLNPNSDLPQPIWAAVSLVELRFSKTEKIPRILKISPKNHKFREINFFVGKNGGDKSKYRRWQHDVSIFKSIIYIRSIV